MYTLFITLATVNFISCKQSKSTEKNEDVFNDKQEPPIPTNREKTVLSENLNEEEQIRVKQGFVIIPKGELALQKNRRYSNGTAPNEISLQNTIMVAKTEVTQKEFQNILGWNPSYFGGCGADCSTFSAEDEGAEKDSKRFQETFDLDELQSECFNVEKLQDRECGTNCPVENISLYDAIHYTNQLSKKDNLPPCFELTNVFCTDGKRAEDPSACMNNNQKGIGMAKISLTTSKVQSCSGYRLLTDVEWEFVARAGSIRDLPATKDNDGPELRQKGCEIDSALDKVAIYGGNSRGMPHDVASKEPNVFGLYDTVGNVWEWVYKPMEFSKRDSGDYEGNKPPKPEGNDEKEFKIMGGSWLEFASYCRIGEYSSMSPGDKDPSTGFRVAITIPQKSK